MLAYCDVIVIFLIYSQFRAIRIFPQKRIPKELTQIRIKSYFVPNKRIFQETCKKPLQKFKTEYLKNKHKIKKVIFFLNLILWKYNNKVAAWRYVSIWGMASGQLVENPLISFDVFPLIHEIGHRFQIKNRWSLTNLLELAIMLNQNYLLSLFFKIASFYVRIS